MNATELTLENEPTEIQRRVQHKLFYSRTQVKNIFLFKNDTQFSSFTLNVFNFLDDKHYQKKFFKIITHNMELNYMPEQNVIYLR